jgi:DNA polymerase-3 subunit delta'
MQDAEVTSSGRAPVEIESYPWHRGPWERLTRDLARLPHALLLHGESGIGKRAFALRLARLLLCRQPLSPPGACGTCTGCRLFAAGTHPDLLVVEPLEGSEQITIDQVRALGEFLALKPHQAAHKVVVLHPAQAMNLNSANSLLKVLEEPPAGALLLLVTHQPSRLPATIRSRCSQLLLPRPVAAEAVSWLAERQVGNPEQLLTLAGGAPLRALALAQRGFGSAEARLIEDLEALASGRMSPLACAARWKAEGAEEILAWLYAVVADLVRARQGVAGVVEQTRGVIPDQGLKICIKSLDISNLYVFLDAVSDARNQLTGPLDRQLLLESLLVRWSHLTQGWTTINSHNE